MAEPREQLATALSEWLTPEQVSKLVDEVLSVEKRTSVEFTCKFCHRLQRQYGSVSDARAVSQALTDLLTQAFGRAGEEAHQGEPIQFIRVSSLNDIPDRTDKTPGKPKPVQGRPRKTTKAPKLNPEAA